MPEALKENDDNAEDIVIVEEQPKTAEAASEQKAEDKTDERISAHDDDDDDVDPDNPDGTDKEREAIRERRRQEKIERKQRREEAIKRDKIEMEFLRKRNDELERRVTAQEQRAFQADLQGLDAQIRSAAQEAEMAEKVIAKAVAAGNGEDVTQAMRYRDQAIARVQQLHVVKQQAEHRPVQQPQIDELTLNHAQAFLKENTWYDPQGRDEDSSVLLAIDQALAKDGYDPRSADYWDELRKRAARRLPERFAKESQRSARGGPAVGSGREHAPASTRKEVYISPERKQALIDAGVWDDPHLRMKYVKRYAEYDRASRS